MLRSRRRGKGNRRWPGRPGGTRKRKPIGAWQRRAQHMVESLAELSQPVVTISYTGVFRGTPEHNIYLFDQEIARIGEQYFAVYHGRWRGFTIYVSKEKETAVAAVAARLDSDNRV